jgi:hypothetical protein
VVLLSGTFLLGAATPAVAVPPSNVPPGPAKAQTPETQARALFRESQELSRSGDLKGALGKLEEAYQILPTPTLHWWFAELYGQLKQPVEGLAALNRYRQEVSPSDMEPGQQLSDADKLEERLRAQLAYLRPAASAGATIFVDGKEIGRAPLAERVSVNPGSHRLSAAGQGNQGGSVDVTVEVQPGQEVEVPLANGSPRKGYFPHPLTFAAVGLTAAFLFATTVVGGMAITDTRNLEGRCVDRLCVGDSNTSITTLNADVSTQRTHVTAASALLGVTTVLAVGTAALIIFDWQRQKAGRTLLTERRLGPRLVLVGPTPAVTGEGAGVALGGRF